MQSFTLGGLFSGVGGIELGLTRNNMQPLWSNDLDKYAFKTYTSNFNIIC